MTRLLRWEADLLFQMTREKLLTEGDRNTKFFHALIKDRQRRKQIKITKPNGSVITNSTELLTGGVQHFQNLFSATPYSIQEELFEGYPQLVTAAINRGLEGLPSAEEVWESILDLSPDSAPEPDGFTGHFCRGCWEIIQEDIVSMIRGFFRGDHLHPKLKSTLLILLPKVDTPADYSDFRPISLSNFASKVVTKILANRFSVILPQVIDEEQYGFMKGRQIHESIALAQELVADIDRKTEGGNIILKFDMSKAYDRLEWRFLLRSLRAMGFANIVQDLVFRSISDITYRININGENSSEFCSTRGVRQGDPLSPLLFIMAQQIFSQNLKKLEQRGDLHSYRLGRNIEPISHLLFADYMLVLSNGSIRSLKCLRGLLQKYESSS